MKIHENVYLVGSGEIGMQMSHPLDCNIYVLDAGNNEYALIDAGIGIQPEKIIANIESSGIKMNEIKYLLITHIHADHGAGASYFKEEYGLKIVMAEEAVEWFETGNMNKTSFKPAVEAGVFPKGTQYPTCEVDYAVNEGDIIKIGNIELEIINTPGHARGHISYLWTDKKNNEKSLFSGDVIFAGGKVNLLNIWDSSVVDYAETINKLKEYKIDKLFPGHGPFLMNDAHSHITTSWEYFNKMSLPPNL